VEVLLNYVLPFLIFLTILVFVHEMGHFWVARRNNVRVEVFSIGFGPEIYGFEDRHGTRWKFSAIPLGGYVKMFGMADTIEEEEEERSLTEEEAAVSFNHKRLSQRAAVVAAGPIANFLFAILAFALLFGVIGQPGPLAAVGTVQSGSAAENAGLRSGDRIYAIDGEAIKWFEEMRQIIVANPGNTLNLAIERAGRNLTVTVKPSAKVTVAEDGTETTIGLLGVTPHPEMIEYEKMGPVQAVGAAVERTYAMSVNIMVNLGQIISGSRNSDEIGGPLRIAHFSGEMFQGGWVSSIVFLAALSINLGLINLFPIPMLDGGHLVFYAFEALIGRPLGARAQEYGFRMGLILVLLLMVYATWNDLTFFKVFDYFQ